LRNTYFRTSKRARREAVEDVDGKKTASLSVAPAQQGHVDMQDLREGRVSFPPINEKPRAVGAAGMSYEEAAGGFQCATGTVKRRSIAPISS
jgi:RNA polymerase sigma-70 factor (ECF subfamily)